MKKLFTIIFSFVAFAGISQVIPNNDFENWGPASFGTSEEPTEWKTMNTTTSILEGVASVTKTTSKFHGLYAANLRNVAVKYENKDTVFGGIMYTYVDITGKPLPGYLKGNIKYSLAPGEKAIISFGYKSVDPDGLSKISIIGIKSFTGNSSNYIPFNIKTNAQYYPSRISDSLEIIISSYNFWSDKIGPLSPSSNLTIDSLGFGGVTTAPDIVPTAAVPNGGFEKWYNVDGVKTPENWFQGELLQFSDSNAITQSSDSRTGGFALKLGIDPLGFPAFVYTFIKPGVNDKYITGFAKFSLGAEDTAVAYLSKYSAMNRFDGEFIDSVIFTGVQNLYKGFSLNFNGKVKVGDTLVLQLAAYNPAQFDNFRLEAKPEFLVDDIVLSAFPLALENELEGNKLSVSPNPSASGVFAIRELTDNANVNVFDVLGNKIESNLIRSSNGATLDISKNPKGIYFLNLENANIKTSVRIVY